MKKTVKVNQNLLQWVFLVIASAFSFFFMLYNDNLTNSMSGYYLMNSIFDGTLSQQFNAMGWSYGITIFAIYAVWSFPLCLLSHVFHVPIVLESIPVLLWYKLLLFTFAIWSVVLVAKIAKFIFDEKIEEIGILYCSSIFFVFPVIAIAQCDIIGLCFVLLGIYYYLLGDDWKFLLAFAMASTMKYFAIFVFIPLVLYRYRKMFKLLCTLCIGASLVIISVYIISRSYGGAYLMRDNTYYVNVHIQNFTMSSIDLGMERVVSLLAFFYGALCIGAYGFPNCNDEERKKYTLWLALAGYSCFFLFYPCNFYWYVLLAPFMTLVAWNNRKFKKFNILLDTLYGFLMGFYFCYKQGWVFLGKRMYSYLFLKEYGVNVYNNALQYFMQNILHLDLESFMPIVYGIAYACIIVFLIINFPGWPSKNEGKIERVEEGQMHVEIRNLLWLRIAILYGWIFLSIFCLIGSQAG